MFRRKIELKTDDQIRLMRQAGLVVHAALSAVAAEVRPGITTAELDAIAAEVIRAAGALPSFLDYGQVAGQPGFPAVACISVNEEVVHGIPGPRELMAGDLVSIDCGAIVEGWHGDAAVSVRVGEVSPDVAGLDEVTRESLWQGISAVAVGGRLSDIGHAIESYARSQAVAGGGSYGLVTDFTGHGIGSDMHQEPDVHNHGRPGRGPKLVPGLCLAIEPMLTLGDPSVVTLDDEWTEVTRDRSVACHWEHTVAVTSKGLWVLTAEDGGEAELISRGVPYGGLDN